MDAEVMKARTKEFAKRIIRMCRKLPNSREGWRIGDQIFRSGTSVGANYRAACRGRSRADFIAKLGIVLKETDETLFWLELIVETEIMDASLLDPLMKECRELLAIFVASLNTAKSRK
ncbi:MAG: four helix bundle protein [Gemmataceae bacterium]|nr:four helix bundle protein [Gemmataceae bacterium]